MGLQISTVLNFLKKNDHPVYAVHTHYLNKHIHIPHFFTSQWPSVEQADYKSFSWVWGRPVWHLIRALGSSKNLGEHTVMKVEGEIQRKENDIYQDL